MAMNPPENNAKRQSEPADKMTFDMMVREMQPLVNEKNTYQFNKCIHRNLLLLGRTRTGKSTVVEVLRDPTYVPKDATLYSETRKITLNRVAANHREKACYFNIIDSPGLYDNTREQREYLTNEKIRQYINECITKDVTDIHAFGFVFSANGGINSEDIKSMIFVKNKYPELKNFFLLIITHCEEKNEDQRQAFIDEFFHHKDLVKHNLKDFFGLGIFFMGCLRPNLKHFPDTNAATLQINHIIDMRKRLLDFLIARENHFNIHRFVPPDETVYTRQARSCAKLFWSIFKYLAVLLLGIFIGLVTYNVLLDSK